MNKKNEQKELYDAPGLMQYHFAGRHSIMNNSIQGMEVVEEGWDN